MTGSAPGGRQTGLIAGIDEAGRGPLAGPVVAAAVVLDEAAPVAGLDDSKKLSPLRREALAVEITASARAYSIAWADRAEIDAINILHATMLAMRRAILGLSAMPDLVLVDGNRLPDLAFDSGTVDGQAIIGGDARIESISAASILAKVARDRMMTAADRRYPAYGFGKHKGYGTAYHLDQIARNGPCDEHRRSFRPMRNA